MSMMKLVLSLISWYARRTPLSTVPNRTGHERLNESTIDVFGSSFKDTLQEVVGLFDLVPVEEVCL